MKFPRRTDGVEILYFMDYASYFVLFTCLITTVGATGDDCESSTSGTVPSFSYDINK